MLRPATMEKESVLPINVGGLSGRITRSRAAALRAAEKMLPLRVTMKQDQKQVLRAKSKRTASDENRSSAPDNVGKQHKRRQVLQDVTNVCCENSYRSCFNATKLQTKNIKEPKKVQFDSIRVVPPGVAGSRCLQANSKMGIRQEITKREPIPESILEKDVPPWFSSGAKSGTDNHQLLEKSSKAPYQSSSLPMKGSPQSSGVRWRAFRPRLLIRSRSDRTSYSATEEKCGLSESSKTTGDTEFVDIDGDRKDPQLCGLYASEIYDNLHVAELVRRPNPQFMETTQQDITHSMRAILVDWLVEVSEEYKLVPDTLYLTVYLIDWYLSQNSTGRQKLQLLGITCLLIASKYEEICAPHVEEFCFITDNTYTREEVLKMETQVLKCFGFQLFAPTAKTFLRRFLRAAQASYTKPSYELEYLADYLAELTLVDYNFLKFLPSVIAASAVFLARWTLDQKTHPWNPTLQHYTSYKASDLKTTLLPLQELQLNSTGCPLNAIRMKYRQEKFKSVAALSSPKLLDTLF